MSDDKNDLRVVSASSAQAVREEKMRVAFAAMAAMLLRHIAGGDCLHMNKIKDFVALNEAMAAESEDPNGIAVPMPDLEPKPNGPDEAINAVLRGALRQTAALLENPRMGEDKTEDYEAARDELVQGIFHINRKLGIPSIENTQLLRSKIAEYAMPGGRKRPGKEDLWRLLLLLGRPETGT